MKRYIFYYFKLIFLLYGAIVLYSYLYYETLLKSHKRIAIEYEGIYSILFPFIVSIILGLVIVHSHRKLFGDGDNSGELRDVYAFLISALYICNFTLIENYLEDGLQPLNRIKQVSELKSSNNQRYLTIDYLPLDSNDITIDVDRWITSGRGAKYVFGSYVILPVIHDSNDSDEFKNVYLIYIDKRYFQLNTKDAVLEAEYDYFIKTQEERANQSAFYKFKYLEHLDEEDNGYIRKHIETRGEYLEDATFLLAHKEPFESRNKTHLNWIRFTVISTIVILFFMSLALYRLVIESKKYRNEEG